MKKFLCVFLAMVILVTPFSVLAQSNKKTSISDVYDNKFSSESILTLNSSDLNTTVDMNLFENFIHCGGIIVVNHDIDYPDSICKELNMNFEPEFFNTNDDTNLNIGTDIATLYYTYGNDLSGIYVINVQGKFSNEEKEALITDTINDIHNTQNSYRKSEIQPLATNGSIKSLGTFTVTTTRMPKGKLTAKYELFTVQNYNGEDYYTAKANITGYPGATLASSDSSYQSKYFGESLGVTIKTTSSGAVMDSYGPHRTVGSSTYSVNVGGSFNANSGASLGANFSYSKSMPDTSIDATSTRQQAVWDVTLNSKAQKKSITFVPAATFSTPASATSIILSVSAEYVLDSWNTYNETISLNRAITCTASSYSQS